MKLFGIEIRRANQRALEDPRQAVTGAEIDQWLDQAGSASGANVNDYTAMTNSAVWAASRVIAETLASLPLQVYERDGNGNRRLAKEHPVYRLLHDEPNEWMTSMVWRETMQTHINIRGNGYSFIRYRGDGRPMELLPLMADKTWPEQKDGRRRYVTEIDGKQYRLDPMDVLHIPGLGWDGMQGYSPIRVHRDAIGLGLSAQDYGARFFSNGATPKGVLEHPGAMSSDAAERLRKDWASLYGGTANSNKTAVLQEGMQYRQISIAPEDAQFLETRKFQVADIARIYRVPPHMIGDLERSTFSNIEQQSLEFVIQTLRPWLVRWEQELNRKLFLPSERNRYFVEFNVDGLLRGDIASRYSAYATGRQWGWLSINDIRRLENMNPVEEGDDYLQPLNMTKAGSDPEADDTRMRGLERSAIERIAASEAAAISRASGKDGFEEWANEYMNKQTERIAADLQVPVERVERSNRDALDQIADKADHWQAWRAEQLRGLTDGN